MRNSYFSTAPQAQQTFLSSKSPFMENSNFCFPDKPPTKKNVALGYLEEMLDLCTVYSQKKSVLPVISSNFVDAKVDFLGNASSPKISISSKSIKNLLLYEVSLHKLSKMKQIETKFKGRKLGKYQFYT